MTTALTDDQKIATNLWMRPGYKVKSANQLVEMYLLHCYLHHQMDAPIIPDKQFDSLAKEVLLRWDEADCEHKNFIHYNKLQKDPTSGAYLKYPSRTISCAFWIKSLFPNHT